MASSYFDFKQFRIYHDRCAMKVGTDGVLLGAWSDVEGVRRILDVGSGCGLIALMAAQRAPQALVEGIDIDVSSVLQANENALSSPFAERVSFLKMDVRDYARNNLDVSDNRYDVILCNPPFYTEDTLPPDAQRSLARNSSTLPFHELISSVSSLLREGGSFQVVIPTQTEPRFTQLCMAQRLYLKRMCRVRTTQRKQPKRLLLHYSNGFVKETGFEEIVLQDGNMRSEAYSRLTTDFYLDYPQPS